ncbi:R-spondin-4 [Megalops cyprinoides]|uniref:R-spondin-4 n=1 Tax=Megalops cyprinoides TaxID=118141 RepID=UPI001864E831|nr:R-spondin-4 [Megalops cyprinoides]
MMLNPTATKRSATKDAPEDCRSCLVCSRENGCESCPDKLFLFLNREDMRQHGSCLHSCPAGHYGLRGQDMNRCMKCKASDCERCFNKDFCTKCKGGFQLFKGKCLTSCPEGTIPHLTDCIEGCQLSLWGEWSPCERNGLRCGFRWGRQSRSRESRRGPEGASPHCPTQHESRKCRMKKKCPEERRKNERRGERKRGRKQQRLLNNATATEPPGGT